MKTMNQEYVRNSIVSRIALLRPEARPRWGKMNAHQMICHLSDSLLCVMGEKSVSIDRNYKLPKLMKWCALYLPVRWPQGVPTRPEIDQNFRGTPPSDFEQDRQRLLTLTETFCQPPRKFTFPPHPIFLHMSEKQWMRWCYLHTDHHLRQFGA